MTSIFMNSQRFSKITKVFIYLTFLIVALTFFIVVLSIVVFARSMNTLFLKVQFAV